MTLLSRRWRRALRSEIEAGERVRLAGFARGGERRRVDYAELMLRGPFDDRSGGREKRGELAVLIELRFSQPTDGRMIRLRGSNVRGALKMGELSVRRTNAVHEQRVARRRQLHQREQQQPQRGAARLCSQRSQEDLTVALALLAAAVKRGVCGARSRRLLDRDHELRPS